MHSFTDMLLRFVQDSPLAIAKIHEGTATRTVPKGAILQRSGDKKVNAFFVRQGCLRSYTIDSKGKEHIFMFGPEGWTVGDFEAQTQGRPTQLYVDAIKNSEIEVLEIDLMDAVLAIMPELAMIAIPMLQKRITVLQKRVISLLSATAAERYADFCATYPSIVQRVPQKMVASYLGVTPEALSKIRGELAKRK